MKPALKFQEFILPQIVQKAEIHKTHFDYILLFWEQVMFLAVPLKAVRYFQEHRLVEIWRLLQHQKNH